MSPRILTATSTAALLLAGSALTGAPSAAATPPAAQPAAAPNACTSEYIRTHTAVRIRERPSTRAKTLSIVPARYYVSSHTVSEDGWYRVSYRTKADKWWYGFIAPKDPHTGKTLASDGWIETRQCKEGERVPAPFPVDSERGKRVHAKGR